MPELPEVETTRRALEPRLAGRRIVGLTVRNPHLRWPVPKGLSQRLRGARVQAVRRRAKYLLLDTDVGHVILHLGMSGRLTLVPGNSPAAKHDHLDFALDDANVLRFTDPRRFGACLFADRAPESHPLLAHLGVEPLSDDFDGAALFALTRGRKVAIKLLLMNANIVTGIGNIYASESLFLAGIHPKRAAMRLSRARCAKLADAVKTTLARAVRAGGTTLRDYVSADGTRGGFQFEHWVYDREGQACRACGTPIRQIVQGQRSTYYCPRCQR